MAKKSTKTSSAGGAAATSAPLTAPGSPRRFRARVRMYRQGLGDCFLLTFPAARGNKRVNILIDCGVLTGSADSMKAIVRHIRDTVRAGNGGRGNGGRGKARLDVVVGTHEHKDHLSGFNQARDIFNKDFEFGAVWLPWTENLTQPQIKKIKEARKKAVARLRMALDRMGASLDGVSGLLGFSEEDDTTGAGKIADALEYLKLRGKDAGKMEFHEPGAGPIALDGTDGVRVYVLGPPRDPILLKGSEVTEKMKQDNVVYHLAGMGEAGMAALEAAVSAASAASGVDGDRYHPFAAEHRIPREVPDAGNPKAMRPNPHFELIRDFVSGTYDAPAEAWRKIDDDWLSAFGQLALDLDNDTNNTSLVLAFEMPGSREVLLFVGDAQVGNWQSWADVRFDVPGSSKPLPAHDLLSRTCFYKVGHHCSHNATLQEGGLRLMTRDDLVAFIPLDKATAKQQGKKDPLTGKPKGWEMPAPPLFKALKEACNSRVVISDVNEHITPQARAAGVLETGMYIDYFLK